MGTVLEDGDFVRRIPIGPLEDKSVRTFESRTTRMVRRGKLLTDEEIPKQVNVTMWVFQLPPIVRLAMGV